MSCTSEAAARMREYSSTHTQSCILQVLRRSGTEQEQKYAKKIEPVSSLLHVF